MRGLIVDGGPADAFRDLAERLEIPFLEEVPEAGLVLQGGAEGAMLRLCGRKAPGPVRVSFDDPGLRHRRRAGHNELLGRAVGWRAGRAPGVLDTTGGFGRDAFVLADLGCRVRLCERNPVMAALLDFALDEARRGDPWLAGVASRMSLHEGDARERSGADLYGMDVIYLDPMFPTQRRALPTKEMQVLHALLGDGEGSAAGDDEGLLAWSLDQPVARVVVKRPRRAPALTGPPPGHVLEGRSVRFDVYPLRALAPKDKENGP